MSSELDERSVHSITMLSVLLVGPPALPEQSDACVLTACHTHCVRHPYPTVQLGPSRHCLAAWVESVATTKRPFGLSFIDPADETHKATVASAAFALGFAEATDQVAIVFLDIEGEVIHRAGVLPCGKLGFQPLDKLAQQVGSTSWAVT